MVDDLQQQQCCSASEIDFKVSDKFLLKKGLPRIDQVFLDDFEARQPWKTSTYRFFFFFSQLEHDYFCADMFDSFNGSDG